MMSTPATACRSGMEASFQHILSLEDTASLMVKVTSLLSSGTFDSTTQDAIVTLSSNLKLHGSSMESSHGQILDSFQQVLRSSCRDQNLDLLSRVHLLEIIELRALKWVPNEHLTNYYRKKMSQLKTTPSKISLASAPLQKSPISCLNTNAPEFTSHQLLTRRPPMTQPPPMTRPPPMTCPPTMARPSPMTRPPPMVLQQPPSGRRKAVQETGDTKSYTKNGAMQEGFKNGNKQDVDKTEKYTVTLSTKDGDITLSCFNKQLFCRAENIIKEKLAHQKLMEDGEIITIKSESSSSLEEKPIKSSLTYDRNDLLKLATSPLCLVPPHNWDEIISQVPSMVKSPNSPTTYNRNDLLKISTSPLCLVPPQNWDDIISQVPSMVKSPTIVVDTDNRMGKVVEDEQCARSPLTYNRNDLLKLATSPLCLVPPHNWDDIISQVPSMVKSPIPSVDKTPTTVDSTDDLMGKVVEDEANRARLQTDFYLR